MNKREVGKKYEDKACDFLIAQGYIILEKNFFTKFGEIDIIAKDNTYLVFVEVKARNSGNYGYGYEAVNKNKQKRIASSAKYYLSKNNIAPNSPMRFDVVSIDNENVELIKNAFFV